MTLLLHISDPHFGTERPAVVRALERLAQRERPALLMLSGDITQRATRQQFDAARSFVQRLGIAAVIALPGNHDIPLFSVVDRLFRPYARYCHAFGTDLEPTVDLPGCRVVAVNTTRWYRHKDGEVSPAQIERVCRALGRDDDVGLRVVMVHQPVAVSRPTDRVNLLIGHEQAVAAWTQAGADLILGGHIHLPFVLALHGGTRQAWCVQAGTAVSSRTRQGAPNSVNLIRPLHDASGRRCEVAQWDFDAGADEFTPARNHVLMLSTRSAHGDHASGEH